MSELRKRTYLIRPLRTRGGLEVEFGAWHHPDNQKSMGYSLRFEPGTAA